MKQFMIYNLRKYLVNDGQLLAVFRLTSKPFVVVS